MPDSRDGVRAQSRGNENDNAKTKLETSARIRRAPMTKTPVAKLMLHAGANDKSTGGEGIENQLKKGNLQVEDSADRKSEQINSSRTDSAKSKQEEHTLSRSEI
jgi:hypothetical protein